MTLRKLIEKYERMHKDNYETVFVTTVIQDLNDERLNRTRTRKPK